MSAIHEHEVTRVSEGIGMNQTTAVELLDCVEVHHLRRDLQSVLQSFSPDCVVEHDLPPFEHATLLGLREADDDLVEDYMLACPREELEACLAALKRLDPRIRLLLIGIAKFLDPHEFARAALTQQEAPAATE